MEKVKCEDCIYVEKTKDGLECHNGPPQIVLIPKQGLNLTHGRKVLKMQPTSYWPAIPEPRWCGQFKANPLTEA